MKAYLKSRAKVITAFLLFESIFAAVLLLSGVPLGAFVKKKLIHLLRKK